MSARPDLPARHPQNVPLSKWTDGWLKMSVSSFVGTDYLFMHEHEKREQGFPVSRAEMIQLLVDRDDIPAAGV